MFKKTISSIVRKFADRLVLCYKIPDIPKVFSLLANFLSTVPDTYFISSEEWQTPLTLTKDGEKRFKERLEEYPSVYSAGITHKFPEYNLVNCIGQFIIAVISKLDYIEIAMKSEYDKYKDDIEKLLELWDIPKDPNLRMEKQVTHFIEKYHSKTTEEAKNDLIKRLNQSKEIMEKLKNIKI